MAKHGALPPMPAGHEADPELQEPDALVLAQLPPETSALVDEPDEDSDEPVALGPQELIEFGSLLTIGRWSKTISVFGHEVVIHTLTNADDIRIGLSTKEYMGSDLASSRGYQIGVVAAGVDTIDGIGLYSPVFANESADSIFEKKIAKVKDMYPLVTTKIYRAIMDLDAQYAPLAEKLGKSDG